MDLDYCGACPKRFRSGDRKRMLSGSPDLCKFVFAHALLDISQWIDVTKETNVLLCNSCYLSFYRKMSASIDNEITSMDVGDTGNARFCEVRVQTDPVLVSNCSIQCDDINRHVPTTSPIIDLPTISRHSSDDTIILPLYRLTNAHKYCGICKSKFTGDGRTTFSTLTNDARIHTLVNSHVFVPNGTRCCTKHILENGYLTPQSIQLLFEKQIRTCTVSCYELMELFNAVKMQSQATREEIEKIQTNPPLQFDGSSRLTSDDYFILTGLDRDKFDSLCSYLPSSVLRHTEIRSPRTAVACLLIKLRLGLSHDVLTVMFSFLNRQTVGRVIHSALSALTQYFVPYNLGFNHVSREKVITQYTRPLAKMILANNSNDGVILVLDGTYVYVQKSGNNRLQRQLYCIYKGRPLVKMMMIVTTKGYIISALGPYYSDSKNTDSMMTKHIFYNNREQVRQWLQDGDVFVVDRGFRDCIPALEQFGYKTHMPAFLSKSERQLTTEEANKTRLTIAVRWVVEARNGQIKQFRFFDKVIPNSLLPFVGPAFNLVCAILNRYHSLCIVDTSNDVDLGRRMLKLVNETDRLKNYAETTKNELRKNTHWQWLDASNAIQDFPKLSLPDLTQMNIGTYQIKQSKSYVLEHMSDDSSFRI